MVHATTLDTNLLKNRRSLNLPDVNCTVAQQIEALRNAAGQSAVDLIIPRPDNKIIKIVEGWPQNFVPLRALAIGLRAETNFNDLAAVDLEDDLQESSP